MLTLLLFAALVRAGTLEILDRRVTAVVAPSATLTVVARDLTWTEGPLFLEDGRLLFADIKTNSIRSVDPSGHVSILVSPSGYSGTAPYPGPEPGSSAMARDDAGRIVVAGHAGRAVWRYAAPAPNGPLVGRTTLVDRYAGRRLNSPNDLVIARDHSIYFTDPPFGLPTQKDGDPAMEQPKARVYRLIRPGEPDSALEVVTDRVKGPNGLAFSRDERTLYVADTPNKAWVRLERRADGTFGRPRPFARVPSTDRRPGEPDGLVVDRRGHVFATGPGGVWIIGPDGRHLGTIAVPGKSSNVTWGDADRRTLFVTAGPTIYRIRVLTGG